jgi:hypothetical protein
MTEPTRPALVEAAVEETTGGFTVRFPSSPEESAAISTSGARPCASGPTSLEFRSASNAFGYVVIAPAGLEEAATRSRR